eukprot:15484583-Alexandrium_andersonii.AAC.1
MPRRLPCGPIGELGRLLEADERRPRLRGRDSHGSEQLLARPNLSPELTNRPETQPEEAAAGARPMGRM